MASRLSLARAARQFASSASRRPVAPIQFSCRRWQAATAPPQIRLFSGSAASQVKQYTEDHEWIEKSDDGKTYTLGISDYAAHALGDVVYIELPQIDLEVGEGDAIGAVESVKSASDINTPVGGTVTEVNSVLEEKPGQINKDPEGEGWIAKIAVSDEPSGKLMTADEYKAFTED